LRLVVPPMIAMLVLIVGTVVYQAEQPSLDDAAYLSPDSRAGIGAATLADRVRGAGVRIDRFAKSSDALVAAYAGNATLLVTTPQLMHAYYLRMLKLMPPTTRVVVVEPDYKAVSDGLMPFVGTRRALTSKVAAPRCSFAPAAKAGPAGVLRTRYGPLDSSLGREVARCYGDALVVYEREGVQVSVVGSADPFRNDRIGERGNAELATGLLTGAPRLIWLDLHRREPPPLLNNDPGLAGGPAAPPSLRPERSGDPGDPEFPIKGQGSDDNGAGGRSGRVDGGDGGDPPNPLLEAFPPWTYVVAALIVFIVVMLALSQAFRLGSPVVEPLPVLVRATETVTGRGRLYQRARARGESLQVLRDAALAKLVRLLRLEPDVDRQFLVEAVAASSGWGAAAVGQVLFGAPPADDDGLVAAATALERLVNAVATEHPAAPAAPPAPAGTSEGATSEGEPR
jgi:hypothetical protein